LTRAILSLWDIMQNYNLWQLVAAINGLHELEGLLEKLSDQSGKRDVYIREPFITQFVKGRLTYCKDQCQIIGLQSALHRLGGPLHGRVNAGAITHEELRLQLRELRGDIDRDLLSRRFLAIAPGKTEMCDQLVATWKPIWDVFPEVEQDARDAVDSCLFGLYTATVFHAMRIAERGLRRIAKRLRVKLTHKGKTSPLEYGDWNDLVTGMHNKILEARAKLPKGPKREARLRFYSEVADHGLFMKEIFRNEVSHSRKGYKEPEALGVLQRVHDFMQFITEAEK
jgi:hypothetical protein